MGHVYASEETLKVHATIARAPEDIAYLLHENAMIRRMFYDLAKSKQQLSTENAILREALERMRNQLRGSATVPAYLVIECCNEAFAKINGPHSQ